MNARLAKIFLPTVTGLLLLILGTVVVADTGSPATITATYDSATGQLNTSGSYTWDQCTSDNQKKYVGFALFINAAFPSSSPPDSRALDGTGMHLANSGNPCTTSPGSWSDNTHILASVPTSVCVVIYDVEINTVEPPNVGDRSETGAGTDFNEDNSYHDNDDSYATGDCTVPTVVSTVGGQGGGGGNVTTPTCPTDRPQKVDQVWFTDVKPGEVTVHWVNKGDAAGFHIAYGPSADNLPWGVEVAGDISQYALKDLPGGDLWVSIFPKSSADCGGPTSGPFKVGAVGGQVLGATGNASGAISFSAGALLIALGLWQAQNALTKRGQKA